MNDRFVWVYLVPLACAAVPSLQFVLGYASDGPLSWSAALLTGAAPSVGFASAMAYERMANGQWRGRAYLPFGVSSLINLAFFMWVAGGPADSSDIGIGLVFLLAIPLLCVGLPLAALTGGRLAVDRRAHRRLDDWGRFSDD